MVLLQEIKCFYHSLEQAIWLKDNVIHTLKAWETGSIPLKVSSILTAAQRWWSSPMKTLRGRQYNFHILTQFSQGNAILDPRDLALIVLTRHKVLVLFTSMELFGTKMFLTYEYSERKAYFHSKSDILSQRNIVLDPPFPFIDSFLRRDRVQLHIPWNG
jgi:hypothetical protein